MIDFQNEGEKKMSKKMILSIDDKLYKRLEQHARQNSETINEFFVRAVCDALDMFDDFYDSVENIDNFEARPNPHFFGNN